MYIIKRVPSDARSARLSDFSPESIPVPYTDLDTAFINKYRWTNEGASVEAFARVGWNENGLYVLMWALEKNPSQLRMQFGSDVWRDSCLEFFLSPDPNNDTGYFNFECNPNAAFIIGIGEGRNGRRVFNEKPKGMDAQKRVEDGKWWAISYIIPAKLLKSEFSGFVLKRGTRIRGNFYKCRETGESHFGMWADTMTAAPDFHRPEMFGDMVLE